MISSKQLAKTLQVMSKEDHSQERILSQFLKFIKNHSLEGLLPSVLNELKRNQKESQLEKSLRVESAYKLTPTDESNIRRLTNAKTAPLVTETNKELLGGFRARYQGVEYEGSLGRAVENLEKTLKE